MHPPTRAEGYAVGTYNISGYRTFHARVGMWADAKEDSASTMRFAVFGDGKLLWASKPIQIRGEEEECVCDVTGHRQLELRVRCYGSNANAWGAWIDPYLVECDAFVAAAAKASEMPGYPEFVASASYWEPDPKPTASDRPPPPKAPVRSVPRQAVHLMQLDRNGKPVAWFSANEVEVKYLQKEGWKHLGLLGYTCNEPVPGTVQLRRFMDPKTKRNSYFLGEPNTELLRNAGLHGWVWKEQQPGLRKVYALRDRTGSWQLTADKGQRDWLVRRHWREMFTFYFFPPN
jgi:hypothetical protein